jgi:DNA-binding response OmpR family regulator
MEAHDRTHSAHPTLPHEEGSDDRAAVRRGPCVVHVEDDDDLRGLCGEILDEAGFTVVGCATLAAGRSAIIASVPDVLLVDRDLPDGSGLDLVRWLRGTPAYASIHVIVFSARKSREDVESAVSAGCDAFLGKPCAPDVLVETIEDLARPDPDAGRRRTGRRRRYAPSL